MTTTSSGLSEPRISATTLGASAMPPSWASISRRTRPRCRRRRAGRSTPRTRRRWRQRDPGLGRVVAHRPGVRRGQEAGGIERRSIATAPAPAASEAPRPRKRRRCVEGARARSGGACGSNSTILPLTWGPSSFERAYDRDRSLEAGRADRVPEPEHRQLALDRCGHDRPLAATHPEADLHRLGADAFMASRETSLRPTGPPPGTGPSPRCGPDASHSAPRRSQIACRPDSLAELPRGRDPGPGSGAARSWRLRGERAVRVFSRTAAASAKRHRRGA